MILLNSFWILLLLLASCSSPTVAGSEAGNSRIEITVVNPVGASVINEKIRLYPKGAHAAIDSAVTNNNGKIVFEKVPYGSYYILSARMDSLLFGVIEVNSTVHVITDTVQASVTLIPADFPLATATLRLEGSPIERVISKKDTRAITGFPSGAFVISLESNSMILQSVAPVQFYPGASIDLDTIEWRLTSSAQYGTVRGGELTPYGLLIQTDSHVQFFTDSTAAVYRIGADVIGSRFTTANASRDYLYLGSDKEFVIIPRSGTHKKFAMDNNRSIANIGTNIVAVISDFAGITLFRDFDSTGLAGAQLPTYSWQSTCATADTDSSLFIGTNKRGVARWTKGDSIQTDTSFLGAKSLVIHAVEFQNNTLWIGTSNGIMSRTGGIWQNHIQGMSFADMTLDQAGELWAISTTGKLYSLGSAGVSLVEDRSTPVIGISAARGFLFVADSAGGWLKPLQ